MRRTQGPSYRSRGAASALLVAALLTACKPGVDIDHGRPGASPFVEVADLPQETVAIATDHLRDVNRGTVDDGEEPVEGEETPTGPWTGARLAPRAIQVFDLDYRNGAEPAYVEFKVIPEREPASGPVPFLEDNERPVERDLGHILVSLHDGDAPVPQFSEEGATPLEELLARVAPTSGIKILRFGPAFATVENEAGELLANAGADVFRVPHDYLEHKDRTFRGDFDSETATEPPADGWGGPAMAATAYESYQAFKDDYLENPVYRAMRERKKRMVADEWALIRGETMPAPERISAAVGETTRALTDRVITRFFLDDDEAEDEPLASIAAAKGGGIAIRGNRAGSAPLTVQSEAGVEHFELRVSRASTEPPADQAQARGFTPGWQPPVVWVTKKGWKRQPRYWQIKAGKWCPQVGCGPVAWGILFAWWDRRGTYPGQTGVPAAFYSILPADLTRSDAPFWLDLNIDYTGYQHVKDVFDDLHDYCDVICPAGATPPGDMVEAGATYLWIPKTFGYLTYNYSWAWDIADPDWNEPSNRIRRANKKHLPAIIGLGWMWHYGVSYAYRYQAFKLTADTSPFKVRRWFRVNEGWNKASGAWYSGYDTFLGAYIRAWQKK